MSKGTAKLISKDLSKREIFEKLKEAIDVEINTLSPVIQDSKDIFSLKTFNE
jgi:hypothetical protein